ncbi:hypothetical protein PF005_g29545 [Phytophthora fragariae]|uniref:Secreted protein n=2 Tax=Phytophthora TaxID=4783 RepID=A0A6A4BDL2_9STRA|nr:hypothetical protein PF003_g38950 [Phytophthora fragariae]KAE8976266.1 hypothetical protein PR002_g25358 [Phytophthora rubi]KAE8919743.1 hypothetical protein PF009_g29954 [Phytophthora fragariae]KAE8964604.1 hypothetical protein PF011_g28601 [Phytophthora fragariae]KAE9062972.1 hypothetical protein PF010_g29181 [Phytophthora fragariae]
MRPTNSWSHSWQLLVTVGVTTCCTKGQCGVDLFCMQKNSYGTSTLQYKLATHRRAMKYNCRIVLLSMGITTRKMHHYSAKR